MKSKRGMEYLREVIVAVIVGLLFLSIGYGLYGNLHTSGDREICRLSVIAKTNTKNPLIKAESNVVRELKCKTNIVQVKKEGIYRNGKRTATYSLTGLDNPDKMKSVQDSIKKAIADEMYDCWYEFKGADPFGQYNSNLRCVPCATITFSDEVMKNVPKLTGFYTTLEELEDDSGKNYLQYLSDGKIGPQDKASDVALLTSKPLSVVFETSKDDNLITAISLGFAGGAATPKGGALINKMGTSIMAHSTTLQGIGAASSIEVVTVETGTKIVYILGKDGLYYLEGLTEGGLKYGELATKLSAAQSAGTVESISYIGTGGKLLRLGGKVAIVATVAILAYDLYNEEEPNMYGIEVVPVEDIGGKCDQFY